MFICFRKKISKKIYSLNEFRRILKLGYKPISISTFIKTTKYLELYCLEYLVKSKGKYFLYQDVEFEVLNKNPPSNGIDGKIYFTAYHEQKYVAGKRLVWIASYRRKCLWEQYYDMQRKNSKPKSTPSIK